MLTLLKLYASAVWKILLPTIKAFLTEEAGIVILAARDAVRQVTTQMPGSTNAQKRDAAVKIVVAALMKQGIPISMSMIYTAIKGVKPERK